VYRRKRWRGARRVLACTRAIPIGSRRPFEPRAAGHSRNSEGGAAVAARLPNSGLQQTPTSRSLGLARLKPGTLDRHVTPNLDREWQGLCGRLGDVGYTAISDDERTWLNVRWLIDSVENGGLISYFYNSGADTLLDCRAALAQLGAEAVIAHVDRVAGLFGLEVPLNIERRNAAIGSWPDDGVRDRILEEVDEQVTPLMNELEGKLEAFLARTGLDGR